MACESVEVKCSEAYKHMDYQIREAQRVARQSKRQLKSAAEKRKLLFKKTSRYYSAAWKTVTKKNTLNGVFKLLLW